jgi:hypothetical protein
VRDAMRHQRQRAPFLADSPSMKCKCRVRAKLAIEAEFPNRLLITEITA